MDHSTTRPPGRESSTSAKDGMTRRERADLAQLVRQRERVAKTATKGRAAELLADVEAQLAAVYKADDSRWADLTIAADAAVASADTAIAARCAELGIPEQFRPSLHLGWYKRGVNASSERRGELRRVATTRIAALEQAARAEIEQRSVDIQTRLLAGGLETNDARTFLASMPTVAQLMPALAVQDLEASVPLLGVTA